MKLGLTLVIGGGLILLWAGNVLPKDFGWSLLFWGWVVSFLGGAFIGNALNSRSHMSDAD